MSTRILQSKVGNERSKVLLSAPSVRQWIRFRFRVKMRNVHIFFSYTLVYFNLFNFVPHQHHIIRRIRSLCKTLSIPKEELN